MALGASLEHGLKYYPMKQFVYKFMQNGAAIFRIYIIIKNWIFSADHIKIEG